MFFIALKVFVMMVFFRVYAFSDVTFDRVHQKVMDLLLSGRERFYYARIDVHFLGPTAQVIDLPEGGGSIDLFQVMGSGEYQLKMVIPSSYEDVQNLRVFYLARYRPEIVRDFQFGSNCFELLNVTEFAKKHLFSFVPHSHGLELNRKAVKHLLAVAGDWYISFESMGDLYLSKVSLLLEPNRKKKECSP